MTVLTEKSQQMLACLRGLAQERTAQNQDIANYTMTVLTEKSQQMLNDNYNYSTKMVVR